jgi:hypothetical protein
MVEVVSGGEVEACEAVIPTFSSAYGTFCLSYFELWWWD